MRNMDYLFIYDVKVTNVADDGVLGHDREVCRGDDVAVTSRGDEDVRPWRCIVHRSNFIASHGGLKSIDGVNLGDDDTSTVGTERLSTLSDKKATR